MNILTEAKTALNRLENLIPRSELVEIVENMNSYGEFIRNTTGLKSLTIQQENNNNEIYRYVSKSIDRIYANYSSYFNSRETEILKAFGFGFIFELDNAETLKQRFAKVSSNSKHYFDLYTSLEQMVERFNSKMYQVTITINQLIAMSNPSIGHEEILFELKFTDKKSNDFKELESLFESWKYINLGYNALFDTSDGIEIVQVEKNSPIEIKIKVNAKIGLSMARVFSAVIALHADIQVLDKSIEIANKYRQADQIENYSKIKDTMSTSAIETITQNEIKESGANLGKEKRGDIEVKFKHAVKNQNLFIINGGTVNITLVGGTEKPEVIENMNESMKRLNESKETLGLSEAENSK